MDTEEPRVNGLRNISFPTQRVSLRLCFVTARCNTHWMGTSLGWCQGFFFFALFWLCRFLESWLAGLKLVSLLCSQVPQLVWELCSS